MEDYNSKYSGEEVDGLLDEIGNKVDKVDGKQLSTEDFTTILKQKLDGLSNYDDTTISQAVEKLRTDLDALVSGDTTTAIKTFNEVIAFLDGISDTEDLSGIIASIEQQIAGKMDSVTLAKVATSGSYNDLSDKPTIPSAVTENTVSGWGFTKNTGTYSKPSTGIPKTDLANGVQTSLNNADSSIQAVDTGDVLDDVAVEYVTKAYFDSVVGDINGILESIIYTAEESVITIVPNTTYEDLANNLVSKYGTSYGTMSTPLSINAEDNIYLQGFTSVGDGKVEYLHTDSTSVYLYLSNHTSTYYCVRIDLNNYYSSQYMYD